MVAVYFTRSSPAAPAKNARDREVGSEAALRERQSHTARRLLCAALDGRISDTEVTSALKKDEYGRPFLSGYPDIYISLSHSGDYAACALADTSVGVDVQIWKGLKAPVHEKFHPAENDFLKALGKGLHDEGFYAVWTRKESFMKADGRGLALGLSSFRTVTEGECDAARLEYGTAIPVGQNICPGDFYLMQYAMPYGGVSLAACARESDFKAEPIYISL